MEKTEKIFINIINNLNLKDYVYLIGFKENVFKYFKNAECFILSSLWEDPGWVIIEAIASNTIVLSSDCPSGPKEILIMKEEFYLKIIQN